MLVTTVIEDKCFGLPHELSPKNGSFEVESWLDCFNDKLLQTELSRLEAFKQCLDEDALFLPFNQCTNVALDLAAVVSAFGPPDWPAHLAALQPKSEESAEGLGRWWFNCDEGDLIQHLETQNTSSAAWWFNCDEAELMNHLETQCTSTTPSNLAAVVSTFGLPELLEKAEGLEWAFHSDEEVELKPTCTQKEEGHSVHNESMDQAAQRIAAIAMTMMQQELATGMMNVLLSPPAGEPVIQPGGWPAYPVDKKWPTPCWPSEEWPAHPVGRRGSKWREQWSQRSQEWPRNKQVAAFQ